MLQYLRLLYFERHQPHIALERTRTRAVDGEPCDFMFTLKDSRRE